MQQPEKPHFHLGKKPMKHGEDLRAAALKEFFKKAEALGLDNQAIKSNGIFGSTKDVWPDTNASREVPVEGGKIVVGHRLDDIVLKTQSDSVTVYIGHDKAIIRTWKNEKMHNIKEQEPAMVEFSETSDPEKGFIAVKTAVAHYCQGELWDPDEETPALTQWFPNGNIKSLHRIINGTYHSRGGRPALETFYKEGGPAEQTFYNHKGRKHRALEEGAAEIQYTKRGEVMINKYFIDGKEIEKHDTKVTPLQKGVTFNALGDGFSKLTFRGGL